MRILSQVIEFIKAHKDGCIAGAISVFALALLAGTLYSAAFEAKTRKSPAALAFEAEPSAWLKNPKDVSAFLEAIDSRSVIAVGQLVAPPSILMYTLSSGERASVRVPNCNEYACGSEAIASLEQESAKQNFSFVRVDVDPRSWAETSLALLASLKGPLLMLITMLVVVSLLVRLQSSPGSDKATLADPPDLRFEDVVGNKEAKAQLQRVVSFLKDASIYESLGARAPRGVLMVGPPGTGKTLLAKALAGESKSKFIAVDGSYFSSMFFGAGISKVKKLFQLARKNAPCVLFIDEIDGIGRRNRASDARAAESESNRIINRLLVEMDGFDDLEGVVVIGATNHESNVDEAMRRPGRFDSITRLSLPTQPDRKALFEMYLKDVKRDATLDTDALGRMTAGASPADIENMVNKAASHAAETKAPTVSLNHVVQAIEEYRLGGEVSPVKDLLSPETRKRLAYHEAGHALVAHALQVGVVEHVTIEPRGEALGVTYVSRQSEEPLFREDELENRLAMMLAGRESELLMLGSVSSGASDDLKKSTELAITMVGNLGFSKKFGVLSVGGVPKEFLSSSAQNALLEEASELLQHAQRRAQFVLKQHTPSLIQLAEALLAEDVVSGSALAEVLERVKAKGMPRA